MREIKFRAWNKETKQMIDLQAITPLALAINPSIAGAGTGLYIPDDERLIIMQFTGLHDKNGREIYEGDVLNVDNGDRYCKVVWFPPQACFDTVPIKIVNDGLAFMGLENSHWDYRCEVIGNIYENPDLVATTGREK